MTQTIANSPRATANVVNSSKGPARRADQTARKPKLVVFGGLLLVVAAASAAIVSANLPRLGHAIEATVTPAAAATAEGAILARATLLALNDANRTGNYSVLHATAAPPFQAQNSPDDLARIFAGQRAAGLDLMLAANEAPRWDMPPALSGDGNLHMRGYYEMPGKIVRFALQFAPVLREWRLMEISIAAEPRQPSRR